MPGRLAMVLRSFSFNPEQVPGLSVTSQVGRAGRAEGRPLPGRPSPGFARAPLPTPADWAVWAGAPPSRGAPGRTSSGVWGPRVPRVPLPAGTMLACLPEGFHCRVTVFLFAADKYLARK